MSQGGAATVPLRVERIAPTRRRAACTGKATTGAKREESNVLLDTIVEVECTLDPYQRIEERATLLWMRVGE